MTETAQKPGLTEFFLRLGEDRSLLTEFERDPRRALVDAGLAGDQVETVLEGGYADVRLALEAELVHDPVWRHVLTPTRMTKPTSVPPNGDDDEEGGGDKDGGKGGGKPPRRGA
ncbi:MAG: hypothetical protein E6G12_01540 [Actinobacteria bacterium]|nr:MAG: hypothetical protein E6G12_01540 [Actinomycetota bacterium]